MTNSKGFTIVEVVIAIVIFSLGVLGLVSTAATVTRMVGRSQQYNIAASHAQQRFEILKAGGCASMVSGSSTSGKYTVSWTVTDVANGKQATASVTYPTARGDRTDNFTTVISCVI